jgi:hypothetical protein
VASTGSDSSTQPSDIKTPLRTIQKAAQMAQPGDTIVVRAGTYRETVKPPRSGRPDAPLVFRTYQGEKVVVNGTTRIAPAAWRRVSGNLFSAPWPGEYRSANNQSDQVFLDGKILNLARWPRESNNDLTRPRQATVDRVLTSQDTGQKTPGPGYPIYRTTFVDAEFDAPDGVWDGAKIWINSGGAHDEHDGNGQTGIVISTNRSRHEITVEVDAGAMPGEEKPRNFRFGKGSAYYLFDPPSAKGLMFDGQWWRDRKNNRLLIRMPGGRSPSTRNVEVRQRDWAFDLDGLSHITVQGFELFATSITTDAAAGDGRGNGGNRRESIAPAHHIVLDGIKARYVTHFTDQTGDLQTQWSQSSGIILSGSDLVIRNSEIAWSAGCGLVMIGQRNKAINNIVHDTNYTATDGGAIGLGVRNWTHSFDHEVAYNTIYNTGIDGIEFGSLKNSTANIQDIRARIHHNLVHDTVLQSADSGAMHTFASDGQWTRIDHNVIYNTGPHPDAYLYFGIYLDYAPDDGKTPARYVVDHNVIYTTPSPINLNHANTDFIFNNTLISSVAVARAPLHSNGGSFNGVQIKNNLANREFRGIGPEAVLQNNRTDTTADFYRDALNPNLLLRDYRLKPGSPAINAGTDVAPFNGNTIGVPDLGAYEDGAPRWEAGAGTAEAIAAAKNAV